MADNWQFDIGLTGSGSCALCERSATLTQSHVIPAFVFRWLKSSGPTGHMRNMLEPNRRVQDGLKRPLLCADCESRLSLDEQLFSTKLFYPWLAGTKHVFYAEWFLRFCVSVSWRVLLDREGRNTLTQYSEVQQQLLRKAERVWRDFLLGSAPNPGDFEQHFLPFDIIENTTVKDLPDNINRYLMGAVEMDIIGSSTTLMTFAKLGRFQIFGVIQGKTRSWKGTKVHLRQGVFPQSKIVLPITIMDFLLDRAKRVRDGYKSISESQYNKISDAVEKNITKALDSDSVRALIADAERFGPQAVLRDRKG